MSFNAGSIEADLTLGRTDWTKDLKRVRQEIIDLENTSITIGVDLDDTNAKIAMDNLELFLDDLDNSTYVPDADLDTTPANTKLDELVARLEAFDASRYTATLDADADNLFVALSNAELFLEDFDGKTVEATVGLNSAAFHVERDILVAQIDELDAKSVDIDVDVDDTAEAIAELELLQAQIALVDGQTIHVDVDYDRDNLEALVGSAGGAGGGGGGGGYMSFWALLIKGIIALSPVLSAAVGAMTGAIVGYSAALVGAIGPALVLAGGIAALVAEFNSTDVADRTPEMVAFADSLDALKDAYEAVIPLIQGPGFNLMAQGLDLAADILPTLVPLFNLTADAISGVLESIQGWVDSPEYSEMLDFFGGFGVDMLVQWLDIFGNVIQFFGRLFDAAAPFARIMMDGLEEVTQGWADWAETLDENQGFIDFMNQAIEVGPQILDMLGSLLGALLNIGEALEPFAGPMLEGLTWFFDLIANMDPEQLSLLIGIGAALYTIVQLAPLVVGLASGLEALVGVIAAIGAPVILVVALIAGLAYVIYHLWQTNEDFRDGILDTWDKIQKTIAPIVEDVTRAIEDNWGPISAWAQRIWEDVQATVEDAFTSIEQIISGVLIAIDYIWENWGDTFIALAEDWFGALGGIVEGAFQVVAGLFGVLSSVLTGDWSGMLDGMQKVWSGWWDIVQNIFKAGWAPVKAAWTIATDLIGKAWSTTMGFLKTKWNDFRTWIGQKWQNFKQWADKWTLSPGEIWTAIKTKWNDMRTWVGAKWTDLKAWVRGWAPSFPSIWEGIQTKWTDMRAWIGTKWSDFKTWVSGFATNPVGVFDGFKDQFRSVINTIIGWWNNLSFSLDIPNKVPGLPDSVHISTPNVPMLARGAYVTDPMVAVIGEGSEPEIVSPESKMAEIVAKFSGAKIDYAALASAVASALRGVLGDTITRDDMERLIQSAGVSISFDRSENEDDVRQLLFEMRRLGFGGL